MIEYMDAYIILFAFMKVPRPKSSDNGKHVSIPFVHMHGYIGTVTGDERCTFATKNGGYTMLLVKFING